MSNNFPPPSVPPPPPAPPQPQQQQQQQQQQQPPIQMNTFAPRFSFHDINLYSLATLQSHLTVKSDVRLVFMPAVTKFCELQQCVICC